LSIFQVIALGDVGLSFSLSANTVEEKTKWATRLYYQHNQSTHITDCVTVTSLAASLLQKISVATDHLCQIMLNRKLRVNSKSAGHFQVALKENHIKWDLPV